MISVLNWWLVVIGLLVCGFVVGYMLFIYVELMFYVFELLLCHVYGLG